MKVVSLVTANFEGIATYSDQRVIAEFESFCRSKRTSVFPKSIKWDAYSVTRNQDKVTVHLHLHKKVQARFCFIPGPRFS